MQFQRKTWWHRWFAWRPVSIGEGRTVWLTYVERRQDTSPLFPSRYRLISYNPEP